MSIKSKAVIFTEPRSVEIGDISLPEPTENDIVVKTLYSGISAGTELWTLTGRYWSTKFPTVPGYQKIGVVQSAGADVKNYQQGDKVYLRSTKVSPDVNIEWAGHTQYSVVNSSEPEMFKIPDSLDPAQGALLCIAAVGYHGAAEIMPVNAGEIVVVIGLGMIGQFSAQTAALRGAEVIAVDLMPQRLDMAEKLAGAKTIAPGQNVTEVLKQWYPQGVDAVIDTSAHVKTVNESFHWLRQGGRYCLQGYYPDTTPLDLLWPHARELTFYNPTNCTPEDQKQVAEFLASGKMKIKEMISHVVPVNEAPKAYDMLLEKRPDVMGVVIDWTKI